jgi:hypothetical protein
MYESDNDETVAVFPNPAKDNITITLKNTILKSVKMYNFLGQEVLFVESNNSEVNISNSFEVGVYSPHIFTENNTKIVRKLIIN